MGSVRSPVPSTTLLSFDWPGHGKSRLPKPAPGSNDQLTLADLVASVEAVISSRIPEGHIALVAHSAGTVVATLFLQQASAALAARISHIVLVGGPLDLPFPAELVERQMSLAALARVAGPQALVDTLMPALTGPTSVRTRPLATALVRALMMAQTNEGYAAGVEALAVGCKEASVDWQALADRYSRVLVIGGSEDQLLNPAELGGLVTKLRARHTTLQAVGQCVVFPVSLSLHTTNVSSACSNPIAEAPKDTADLIVEFLNT